MPAAAAHGAPPPTPKPHPAHLHRARRTTGHTPDTADTTRVAGLGGGRARGPGAGPARATASGPGRPPAWRAPAGVGRRARAARGPGPGALRAASPRGNFKSSAHSGPRPPGHVFMFHLKSPHGRDGSEIGVETSRISLSVQCGLSLPGRLRSSARQLDSVPQLPSTGELRTPRWTSHLWLARCVTPAHSQKRVLTTAHVSARVSSSSRVVGRSRRAAIAPLTLYCTLLAALSWRSKTGRRHSSASSPWPPPPPLPFLCCRCGCRWSPWSY